MLTAWWRWTPSRRRVLHTLALALALALALTLTLALALALTLTLALALALALALTLARYASLRAVSTRRVLPRRPYA